MEVGECQSLTKSKNFVIIPAGLNLYKAGNEIMGIIFSVINKVEHDLPKWTCQGSCAVDSGDYELDFVRLIKNHESYTPGYLPGVVRADLMFQRAKELDAATGILHAEAILRDQIRIPEECRNYFLVFPGEIWTGHYGTRYMICLSFDVIPKYWCLNFRSNPFEGGYGANVRIVKVIKKICPK